MIAFDIKNVVVIPNKINTIEAVAHIDQAFPISILALKIPLL